MLLVFTEPVWKDQLASGIYNHCTCCVPYDANVIVALDYNLAAAVTFCKPTDHG